MGAQIPSEAAGVVAAVLTYSSICLVCSTLMVWLTWTHNERTSYVACIAYFTTLSTACSIIQQIHDFVWWKDVMIKQFENTAKHPKDPELAIANGSIGLDLVLYYIQYYSYSVEAMFVMFWAFALVQSVYGLLHKPRLKHLLSKLNRAGKVVSIAFPVITILSLRSPAVQSNFITFILLADLPLMLSLALGSASVLSILVRYVQSRRRFQTFSPSYGQSSQSGSTQHNTSTIASSSAATTKPPVKRKGVYDRWLLTRFSIAFTILSAFELTNTLFQISSIKNTTRDATSTTPDLGVERAKTTFLLFLPGVTPSLLLFAVFGTTRTFLDYLKSKFTPRCACFSRRQHPVPDDETGSQHAVLPRPTTPGPTHLSSITSLTSPVSIPSGKSGEDVLSRNATPRSQLPGAHCYYGCDRNIQRAGANPEEITARGEEDIVLKEMKAVKPLPRLPGQRELVRAVATISGPLPKRTRFAGPESYFYEDSSSQEGGQK